LYFIYLSIFIYLFIYLFIYFFFIFFYFFYLNFLFNFFFHFFYLLLFLLFGAGIHPGEHAHAGGQQEFGNPGDDWPRVVQPPCSFPEDHCRGASPLDHSTVLNSHELAKKCMVDD
jgi:hypothetical protein